MRFVFNLCGRSDSVCAFVGVSLKAFSAGRGGRAW